MTLDDLRAYCAHKPGVTYDTPFGPDVLVFRVGPSSPRTPVAQRKIFALVSLDLFDSINLKCDPERAAELRERFAGITPGYHMNKRHWNTVRVKGGVPEKLLYELVDHSYELVKASLPEKLRQQL